MESKEDACCGGNLMGITGVNNNFQTYGYTDQFNMGKPGVSDDMPNGMKPNADSVDGKDGETGKNDATRKGADSVEEKDGKVIFASVRIHTAICPECGRSYVSGGVTDTQIKYYNESNPYQQDLKATDGMKARGERVDLGV